METGQVVEEVEYEATEIIKHEDAIEEVIYVGGKTQSVYTPKKNKQKWGKIFWDMIKPEVIEEEGEVK